MPTSPRSLGFIGTIATTTDATPRPTADHAASRLRRHAIASAVATALAALPVAAMAQGAATDAASPAAASDDAPTRVLDVVLTTGTRGAPRTVADSPAPIDVIGGEQLQKLGGNTALRDALSQLLPSFLTTTQSSLSADSIARPAGLRGLSGAHVLVLVNGKRRHNSSIISLAPNNQSNGSNPVDIDLIPVSAIDHIEVLRDGAAAQYGSDAIAGVLNIILKRGDQGGGSTTTLGTRHHDDNGGHDNGTTVQEAFDIGFALPGQGFLRVALDGKLQEAAVRNTDATGNFYFPVNGQPDPREATVNKKVYAGGLPEIKALNLSYNAERSFDDTISGYSFGTVSVRKGRVGQNFRRPNSLNIIPSLYPDGTAPVYTLDERDFQFTAGVLIERGGWNWDLSSSYGLNHVDNGSDHTLNASLGPTSPTRFDTFSSRFTQWTNNLDATRAFDVGLAKPLQASWGLEHRQETYRTRSGDPLSYAFGGYVFPSGPLAGSLATTGAQGAITVTPADEADLRRNSVAAYVDFGLTPVKALFIGLAARAEHYDDGSGNTASGKLSARYELSSALALRATVSNGFRAPALPQSGFAQTSNQYNIVNGVSQFVQSKSVQVNSAIGQALGARTLKPEKSTNVSAGLTWSPSRELNVTLDAYRIDLKDRIAQTGFLAGAAVNQLLIASGFQSGQSIKYFANAIDTRTSGLDLVGDYTQDLRSRGTLRWTLGFNFNKTRITRIADNPSQLAGLGLTLFDRAAQGAITDSTPRSKLILGAAWRVADWDLTLRTTRYDKNRLLNVTPQFDQAYAARWVTDLDVGYRLNARTMVAVGANNLFNIYPSKNTVPDTNGFPPYSSISPFGIYGAYYYARVGVTF
ncbi:MAG: TonB-dependent receptor [Mitsuaria chitosanitabida]|uniref:TonB-dependent receptor plug domain-containing protein n=1 Tax=Roseateles chitosanitabidus TaxID=65048 RepID=UPI001B27E0B2|nr:TonB-dependent receptor [Roseateles chitosanitabidus]MBO9687612.1 TonB-dependent receptor [Roseateles chitosanitabidus]